MNLVGLHSTSYSGLYRTVAERYFNTMPEPATYPHNYYISYLSCYLIRYSNQKWNRFCAALKKAKKSFAWTYNGKGLLFF